MTPGASHVRRTPRTFAAGTVKRNGGSATCYTETMITGDVVTAFCYCGWTEDHATEHDAETAAERHAH